MSKQILTKRASIFKALSHPARLIIVEALKQNERCVCELNELVDLDQSTLSRHLSVLKNVGLIQDEKRGLNVFYKLSYPCVLKAFDCIDLVWKTKN